MRYFKKLAKVLNELLLKYTGSYGSVYKIKRKADG